MMIAQPAVPGPYNDVADFTLSFHLKGSCPVAGVLPLQRRAMSTPLFLGEGICALVRFYIIARWMMSLVVHDKKIGGIS